MAHPAWSISLQGSPSPVDPSPVIGQPSSQGDLSEGSSSLASTCAPSPRALSQSAASFFATSLSFLAELLVLIRPSLVRMMVGCFMFAS
ncbi:hypothetical protein Acr_00g0074200 [Actinidia rufa]|uniref:Uncharacterized protein n=1 Tax=Actinidia rufa TaxID=165716 RepID=A0A7J0DSB3_9ERIC|nr:hypothetical protein Acr_00g0074200 [Actinidia rufa]